MRGHLPRRWATYRGLVARDARLLDVTLSHPDYKDGVVAAIANNVSGKHVELVGFGRGITTVLALKNGATHVTAYEAAAEMIPIGVETMLANNASLSQVTLHHALVGPAVDVFGSADGARSMYPSELGCGDVLVLDCEGAEGEILKSLSAKYDTIIVEDHPPKGTVASELVGHLEGYKCEIVDYEPDRPKKSVVVANAIQS